MTGRILRVVTVDGAEHEVPHEPKPYKPLPLPRGLTPITVPKFVNLLLREGVKVPERGSGYTKANMERVPPTERVAVCRGLPRAVRGCWWEVVSIHPHGSAAARKALAAVKEADPALGAAIVLLDSGDKAVRLIAENGDVIPR